MSADQKWGEQFAESMADIADPTRHHKRMFIRDVTEPLEGDGLTVRVDDRMYNTLVGQLSIAVDAPNGKRYEVAVTRRFIEQGRMPWDQSRMIVDQFRRAIQAEAV